MNAPAEQQPLFFDQPTPVAATKPRTPRPVVREIQRRQSNRDKVLARLQEGPATTMQLIAIGGARAVARCWDLQQLGYVIEKREVKAGLFVYRLIGKK